MKIKQSWVVFCDECNSRASMLFAGENNEPVFLCYGCMGARTFSDNIPIDCFVKAFSKMNDTINPDWR